MGFCDICVIQGTSSRTTLPIGPSPDFTDIRSCHSAAGNRLGIGHTRPVEGRNESVSSIEKAAGRITGKSHTGKRVTIKIALSTATVRRAIFLCNQCIRIPRFEKTFRKHPVCHFLLLQRQKSHGGYTGEGVFPNEMYSLSVSERDEKYRLNMVYPKRGSRRRP